MKNKTPFSLHQATLADIEIIESMLYPGYLNESGYKGLTYDREATLNTIKTWLEDGSIVFIATSGGKVAGMVSLTFMRMFYKELEADVEIFYVKPEYRGTGIARALVDMVSRTAELNGAKVVYSSCLSGMGDKNNKMYVNLWKKYGFRELGTVMVRS